MANITVSGGQQAEALEVARVVQAYLPSTQIKNIMLAKQPLKEGEDA